MKSGSSKCRVCGIGREEAEFKKGGNICKKCLSDYNKKYSEMNRARLRERNKILYQLNKEKRKEAARKAAQRSPEAFIRNLLCQINKNKAKRGIAVNIDYDYLISLYEKQGHRCAISDLIMTFEFNNPRSISVDRIDSSRGYEPGNVQLVCQAFNWMKNKAPQEQIAKMLDDYYAERCNAENNQ